VFPKAEGSGNGRLRAGQAAAALICVALAAGCSSSPSSSPSSSSSSPAAPATSASSSPPAAASGTTAPAAAPSTSLSPAVAGPAPCATSGLNVTLGPSEGYAGGVDQTIVFTNTSGAMCTLYGYPGVSLVTAPPYTQIGLAADRSSTVPVKQITLAPGASANAVVQIVDALNFGSATCSPTQAAFLRVYPPNQTAPVYLANTSQTCAQPVQTLSVTAVQAGSSSTT
jgi:hypothetical protein